MLCLLMFAFEVRADTGSTPANGCKWRKADKTVVASIRLAGGCEGSHDFVDAGFKLGDRERFLKKRKRGRILTHRLIIIDAPPLCIHRDLRPVSAAMEAGRNKAPRPTH